MKNVIRILFVITLVSFCISAWGQAPPPPPGNAQIGGGGSSGPVGAPIDGGFGILIIMGLAYGGIKYYQAKKIKAVQQEVNVN